MTYNRKIGRRVVPESVPEKWKPALIEVIRGCGIVHIVLLCCYNFFFTIQKLIISFQNH